MRSPPGKDTGGRYCLTDMHVPLGGGPPPHRHCELDLALEDAERFLEVVRDRP
jgi:hypothetical protein